jgi:formate hydrogenlyase transcriptional activator
MDLHPGPEKSRVSTVKLLELEPVQQALHDNKDWYQDLVEHGQDLLCIHDLQGRLLLVNPAPARVLGYSVEEMLKIPMREMIIPEFRPDFDAYLKDIAITGESHGWMGVMTRSGERRIWEYRNTLRTDGVSSPIVRGMAHDVTEQRRAEEMAREANELLRSKASENERTIRELNLFRTLVDHSNDAIEVVDLETLRFMDANEKACSTLGYTREELLSLRVLDIDPGVTESSIETIREQWRKMGWLMLETVHRRKDGSTFPVEVSTRQVHVDRDYVVAIVRDITERKQAEERLREYERVVEGLEEIIMVVDRDYRYVIANRAFLNSRGLEREQVIGHIVDEVVNREVFETVVKEKMDECFGGKVVQYELRYRFPRLGERDLQVSYFPIEGPKGVDRIAAILRDITERKQADGALQRSEERYRNFISQSSEGIFRMDAHIPIDIPEAELIHRILYEHYMVECNDAMAAMYGLTSGEQMRGKRFKELVVAEDPHNIEFTREFIRNGFRVIDRESHEVDIHGNPKVFLNSMIGTVENGMLTRTWGIQRDITEKLKLEQSHRRGEEALRQNLAQLQKVTEELRLAKEKLSEEKLYLEESIDTELGFGEIIGRSRAMKEVMEKVAKVAPSDATVLLLGETGTGKELVARALHRMSRRDGNSFIKLNCAAIPSGLLESELFGHEKGAFTGAVARKPGRLELADRGTLFLDEVGEIPLSLQPKLLRVLQDLEFERLGGTQTLKVNFRLLAATNRDLQQSVKAREFRSDLYYRVNVFPILIPPLRERREDIQPLVWHFVSKFAAQMKKSITSVPSKTMEMLVRWDWPGNIRELENFVERSVILTPGSVLRAPLAELQTAVDQGNGSSSESLRDKERERILRTLRECHGKLGGPDGAAARLGLKRTTLQSRLDHLGIKPGGYRG